jgi:hypothetical protein
VSSSPASLSLGLNEFPVSPEQSARLNRDEYLELLGQARSEVIDRSLRLTGALDTTGLSLATDALTRIHQGLGMYFQKSFSGDWTQHYNGGGAVFRLASDAARDSTGSASARYAKRQASDGSIDGTPMVVECTRIGDREHLVRVFVDHLVADGISLDILTRDLITLYNAFLRGDIEAVTRDMSRRAQSDYINVLEASQDEDYQQSMRDQLQYWREVLDESTPIGRIRLSFIEERPDLSDLSPQRRVLELPNEISSRLLARFRASRVTPYAGMMCAVARALVPFSEDTTIPILGANARRTRIGNRNTVAWLSTLITYHLARDRLAESSAMHYTWDHFLERLGHGNVSFHSVKQAVRPNDVGRPRTYPWVFFDMSSTFSPPMMTGLDVEIETSVPSIAFPGLAISADVTGASIRFHIDGRNIELEPSGLDRFAEQLNWELNVLANGG